MLEKLKKENKKIALILFCTQLIHLYWLAAYVLVPTILFGHVVVSHIVIPSWLFVSIDYIEIPALISGIFFYISAGRSKKNILMLALLGSQIIHMFFLTDQVIINTFSEQPQFPVFFAVTAILIDYLELPVLVDLARNFFKGESNENRNSRM